MVQTQLEGVKELQYRSHADNKVSHSGLQHAAKTIQTYGGLKILRQQLTVQVGLRKIYQSRYMKDYVMLMVRMATEKRRGQRMVLSICAIEKAVFTDNRINKEGACCLGSRGTISTEKGNC